VQQHGKRRTVYGKTETEARRKLSALNRDVTLTGGVSTSGVKTLDDLLSRWMEPVRPTLKPKTAADYVHVCERYVRPRLGKLRLSQLTPEHLQRLYNDLQRQRLERVPAQVHAVLHRVLRMAVLWRWLPENPADRVMRPTYRAPRNEVWTKEQLSLFLACSQEHKFGSLWLLALTTGCRLGELLALRWADVKPDSGKFTIRRTLARINREWIESSPKTQAGERTITIPSESVAVLRHQRAVQAAWRLQSGTTWVDDDRVFSNLSAQCRPAGLSTPSQRRVTMPDYHV
jgi:integrase